jgi:hypothetical protein
MLVVMCTVVGIAMFASAGELMRKGTCPLAPRKYALPVKLQFAKPPSVMVVDPEKPSGYAGGTATEMDKKVMELVKQGLAPEEVAAPASLVSAE